MSRSPRFLPDRRSVVLGLAAGLLAPMAVALGKTVAPAMPPSINAAELGLRPDSNADQTAQLQQALTAATSKGLALALPSGTYRAGNLMLPRNAVIFGARGARILGIGGGPILRAEGQSGIILNGLALDGSGGSAADGRSGLIALRNCTDIRLEGLTLHQGAGNGIYADGCSGWIGDSVIDGQAGAGIFVINSHQLTVRDNHILDCGNAGILVWQDQPRADGTLVVGNHISRIAANGGGNGQNGNGINVFRADNVTVADNRISDCAFSSVRANTARNIIIRDNTCTRSSEVAIYAEFAFSGAVISGNIVDGASGGISMTNFNQGGQLATCTANIVRNIMPSSPTNPDATPFGIYAEANTAITGNAVSKVPGTGIGAGYGKYLSNVVIASNIITEADTGIAVSVVDGAGAVRIAENVIAASLLHAIVGMKWNDVATPDLVADAARFPNVAIADNTISR